MQVFILLGIIGYTILRLWKKVGYSVNNSLQQEPFNQSNEYFIYTEDDLLFTHKELHQILHKYVPFYVTLNNHQQAIFIDRLQQFFLNKKFIICGTTPYKEMPILVAACAIQISFRLSDYSFSYFKYIIIRPKEYQSPHTDNIIEGNVYGNSITIGFENLVYDFKVSNDGHHVGLHEMAHALYVQNKFVYSHDAITKNPYFKELILYGNQLITTSNYSSMVYTHYALSNEQEFWACSVELFFEQPHQLQQHYPLVHKYISKIWGW